MAEQASSRSERWAPAGSTFAPNPEFGSGRAFSSTDHLAADAVVAYVDGVLRESAAGRVDEHVRLCAACAAEIAAQASARSRLRTSCEMSAPPNLVGELSQIPTREIDMRDLNRRSR
ncbi:MAG: zf-HC2 domain-containing protein [Gordonia sp. (in: high G+C Gram-positive bacteria)]|uniref:zf-HC2 domain-containing protein n=1 Tax=Gordonia sp. (in: high G+C Gram-positive bacteria) TaxID=84139 RepID=UPI003BB71FF6